MGEQKKLKKNKKIKNKIVKAFSMMCFLSAAMTGEITSVYGAGATGGTGSGDKLAQAAKGAAEGMQASAAGMTRWIIAGVMIVIGMVFLVGTQQQKETTKAGIFIKLVGVACVICAIPVSGIIFAWF